MLLHRILILWGTIIAAGLWLSACSTVDSVKSDRKVDYRTAQTLPPLEIPPDLNSVSSSGGTTIPGVRAGGGNAATTYSAEEQIQGLPPGAGGQVASRSDVLPSVTNARIERAGSQRWLVVKGDPDQLWGQIRNFFLGNGLVLVVDNPQTGVMETEWAENYADVGNAWQKFQAKYLGGLFTTGTRDKFRVRLERGYEPGTSEIYLTHRRMEETMKNPDNDAYSNKEFKWVSKPADPNLEAEMLRLLMLHLGIEEEKAKKLAVESKTPVADRAKLSQTEGGAYALTVQDEFSRAWQRVGLSLDRIGFTVEDRNRSDGIYYVRLVNDKQEKKRGFFSRMFRNKESQRAEQYQVKLEAEGSQSIVTVNNKNGEPEKSDTSKKILSMLHEQLK